MNPQLKSIVTSILTTLSGTIATFGVTYGIIPAADKASATNILVSMGLYVLTAALMWYKSRSHTPTAQIAAVNDADNGVKVVPASVPAAKVTAPIPGGWK